MNTTQLHKALLFALDAHKGQVRKGKQTPYIIHPIAVSILVAQAGGSEEAIIAALLHDTVEDTPVTLGQIRHEFGKDIADLVLHVTETDKTMSWKERKQIALDHIPEMPQSAVLLKSADVLHNLTETVNDYKEKGAEAFKVFTTGSKNQIERYINVVGALEKAYPSNPLLPDLTHALIELKGALNKVD